MRTLCKFGCCLVAAVAAFGASAEVLWDWDGSKLTEILPEESTETAWQLNLSAAGALSLAKEGTNPVLDLRAETMPAGVYEIKTFPRLIGNDNGAANCTTVYLPASVTTLAANAFRCWKKLTSVHLDQTAITEIPGYCFFRCSALSEVVLPDSVTSIAGNAFQECSALTSVNLTDGLTAIGGNAFYSCSSLASIALPETLTTIGSSAFQNCTSLERFEPGLPSGLVSIDHQALRNCPKLTTDFVVGYALNGDEVLATAVGNYLLCDSRAVKTVRLGPGVSTLQANMWSNTDPAFVDLGCNIPSTPSFPNGYTSLTNLIVRYTGDFLEVPQFSPTLPNPCEAPRGFD